jgi:hypothetical protein
MDLTAAHTISIMNVKKYMKKILVTGGMLTYMVLFNAGISSAQMLPEVSATEIQASSSQESIGHENNFEAKITRLALRLNINPDDLIEDIASHKSTKEILKKHGITKSQLSSVFGKRSARYS